MKINFDGSVEDILNNCKNFKQRTERNYSSVGNMPKISNSI